MLTRESVFVLRWKICAIHAALGGHSEVYSLDGLGASLSAANPASTQCGKRRLRPVKGETTRRYFFYSFIIPPDCYTSTSKIPYIIYSDRSLPAQNTITAIQK